MSYLWQKKKNPKEQIMSKEVCECKKVIRVSGVLTHCIDCKVLFLTDTSKYCLICSNKKGTCVYCGKKRKTKRLE